MEFNNSETVGHNQSITAMEIYGSSDNQEPPKAPSSSSLSSSEQDHETSISSSLTTLSDLAAQIHKLGLDVKPICLVVKHLEANHNVTADARKRSDGSSSDSVVACAADRQKVPLGNGPSSYTMDKIVFLPKYRTPKGTDLQPLLSMELLNSLLMDVMSSTYNSKSQ